LLVIAAARRLKQEGLAEPVLISNHIVNGVETIDPSDSPRRSGPGAPTALRTPSRYVERITDPHVFVSRKDQRGKGL